MSVLVILVIVVVVVMVIIVVNSVIVVMVVQVVIVVILVIWGTTCYSGMSMSIVISSGFGNNGMSVSTGNNCKL